jgi:hypothetical protein
MEDFKLNEYRIAANPSYQNHCWLILRIPSPFFFLRLQRRLALWQQGS